MKTNEESQSQEIEKAAAVLKGGGIVVFPTDTVYGIGCLNSNQEAIGKIYAIKGRSQTIKFPVLVANETQVEELANVTDQARDLISKHWPGALTVVLERKDGMGTCGFRMPNSSLIQELIEKAGEPIIGTSANFHTKPSAKTFKQLDPELIKKVDFVIKGECKMGMESTVVDATVNPPQVLRQGAVKI